jgi:hypothetical protein
LTLKYEIQNPDVEDGVLPVGTSMVIGLPPLREPSPILFESEADASKEKKKLSEASSTNECFSLRTS